MQHPVKIAFCPIYFEANGGQYTDKGTPIFKEGLRGVCSDAFDCRDCPLMIRWSKLRELHYRIGWECDKCLKDTFREDKKHKITRWLPAFYHSGICTQCGYQRTFLQLILRR